MHCIGTAMLVFSFLLLFWIWWYSCSLPESFLYCQIQSVLLYRNIPPPVPPPHVDVTLWYCFAHNYCSCKRTLSLERKHTSAETTDFVSLITSFIVRSNSLRTLTCPGRLLTLLADVLFAPCHTFTLRPLQLDPYFNYQSFISFSTQVYFTRLTAMLNHELGWEIWQRLHLDVSQLQRKLNNYWKMKCWVWEFEWIFLPPASVCVYIPLC